MSLLRKTVHAVSWTLGGRQLQQLATLFITAVLAKLLTPEDFGLMGMVTVLSGMAMILSDTGFSAAVIQRNNLTQVHYSTLFWVNLGIGLTVSCLFFFAAPLIAAFYQRPELTLISQILSVSFTLSALSTIPQALMRRAMRFKRLTIIDTVVHLSTGTAVVVMALNGYGIWALVAQPLIQQTFKAVMMWWHCPWRPSLVLSVPALKDVFNFSANILGLHYLQYFMNNLDYLLVGRFLGAEALGYYTLAYKLMFVPIRNICQEIVKVLFPALSRLQDDPKALLDGIGKALRSTCYIVFPMLMGMFMVADIFIETIFGEQWAPTIEVLQVLCLVGLVQAVITVLSVVFRATGQPQRELRIHVARLVVMSVVLLSTIQFGLVPFTWSLLLVTLLFMVVYLRAVAVLLQAPLSPLFAALWPALGISSVMALCLWWLRDLLAKAAVGGAHELALLIVTGAGLYGAGLGLLWLYYRRYDQRLI
ncbi:MOP flippase family protein [Ferrimonas balearica]|uniref:MOP flippase family protein n=1 Tax=Ferrimonas balearica TaxID=44012 RepID=UPI001C566860|nr:MOP flippase family protein [Ferrimonas balearica]MBW3141625.1 MOP flippase family protein [Ferrimonas balearica]